MLHGQKYIYLTGSAFHEALNAAAIWNSLDVELDDTDEFVKTSGYGGVQYSSVRKKIDKLEILY